MQKARCFRNVCVIISILFILWGIVVNSIYDGKEKIPQFDIILFQVTKHPDINQYVTELNIHKYIKLIYPIG